MKIDHVTFSNTGGAGIVANTIARAQRDMGHEVDVLTVIDSDLRSQPLLEPALTLVAAADEWLASSHSEKTLFSPLRGNLGVLNSKAIRPDSVIHLHWVAGVLNHNAILRLLDSGRKVVWTMHDMNPFTGGCHHSHSCQNFVGNCSNCPQARSIFRKTVELNIEKKRLRTRYPNLRIVSPTQWMSKQVSKSFVFRDQYSSVIPNPIDDEFFFESNQSKARDQLRIPQKNFVAVVIAKDLRDRNKNVEFVIRALEEVSTVVQHSISLILIGKNGDSYSSSKVNLVSIGELDLRQIPAVASAADVLLSGSLAESAGMTILECSALGIPAIALENGGTSSSISDGVTGLLAQNLESFVSQILSLANDPSKLMLLKNASKQNANLYGAIRVAKQYVEVYESFR